MNGAKWLAIQCGRDDSRFDFHVVPDQDLREHDLHPSCWCKPREDEETPFMWVHNALDQRELWEEGERLLA